MISNLLINNINKKGKKFLSQNLYRRSLLELKNTRKTVHHFLTQALTRSQPRLSFKTKKVAGTLYKIPSPYKRLDDLSLSARWLVEVSRRNKKLPMFRSLAKELADSSAGKGEASKKTRELHRQVIANKTNLKYM